MKEIQNSVMAIANDFGLKKVVLFGSYATGKQTEESDIDLLVEFISPSVSLFKVAGLKLQLEELTGKSVDVIPFPIPKNSLLEIDKEVLLYECK